MAIEAAERWREGEPLKLFAVAGEHSGDRLGGKLLAALRARLGDKLEVVGVGGEDMLAEGLKPIFPMADVAVMGFGEVLKRLPKLAARIQHTVAEVHDFSPHMLLIIDSPDFTHRVAKRVRRQCPDVPIIDYVSPTVWAWRPGRAKAMAAYVDHLLALLPFEPEAHARLGGPPCTYVGHPILERLDFIAAQDPAALATRLGLISGRPMVNVLPGSRRGTVRRLMPIFRGAIEKLTDRLGPLEILMPAVAERAGELAALTAEWPARVHIVTGEPDKFAAFRLARATLAASGTVTLELAAAGAPMVVAYKVERWVAPFLRPMIMAKTIVLPNLVLGENAFPEFIQEDCTPEKLSDALAELMADGEARAHQRAALARIPTILKGTGGSPSGIGADCVLAAARQGRRLDFAQSPRALSAR